MTKQKQRQQKQKVGKDILLALYPEALSKTYSVPPIRFNRVCYVRETVAGQSVLVRHPVPVVTPGHEQKTSAPSSSDLGSQSDAPESRRPGCLSPVTQIAPSSSSASSSFEPGGQVDGVSSANQTSDSGNESDVAVCRPECLSSLDRISCSPTHDSGNESDITGCRSRSASSIVSQTASVSSSLDCRGRYLGSGPSHRDVSGGRTCDVAPTSQLVGPPANGQWDVPARCLAGGSSPPAGPSSECSPPSYSAASDPAIVSADRAASISEPATFTEKVPTEALAEEPDARPVVMATASDTKISDVASSADCPPLTDEAAATALMKVRAEATASPSLQEDDKQRAAVSCLVGGPETQLPAPGGSKTPAVVSADRATLSTMEAAATVLTTGATEATVCASLPKNGRQRSPAAGGPETEPTAPGKAGGTRMPAAVSADFPAAPSEDAVAVALTKLHAEVTASEPETRPTSLVKAGEAKTPAVASDDGPALTSETGASALTNVHAKARASPPLPEKISTSCVHPEKGSSKSPRAEKGSSTSPRAEKGSSTSPRAEKGSSKFPRAEKGSSTSPRAEKGSSTSPRAEKGSSTSPRAEKGSSKSPRAEKGSSKSPLAEKGNPKFLQAEKNIFATLPADKGNPTGLTLNEGNPNPQLLKVSPKPLSPEKGSKPGSPPATKKQKKTSPSSQKDTENMKDDNPDTTSSSASSTSSSSSPSAAAAPSSASSSSPKKPRKERAAAKAQVPYTYSLWPRESPEDVQRRLRPAQYNDLQEDIAQHHVLVSLAELGEQLGEVMFILSEFSFDDYLKGRGKGGGRTGAGGGGGGGAVGGGDGGKPPLPVPGDLETQYRRGDFDILVIHRQYGILVGEAKSVGWNQDYSKTSQADADADVAKRVEKALTQLDKSETVMRHLLSDLQERVTVKKALFLPYISAEQLRRVFDACPALEAEAERSLGVAGREEAIAKCCLRDQLTVSPAHYQRYHGDGPAPPVPDPLKDWWASTMAYSRDPVLNDKLYLEIVGRFVGPASSVSIHCVVPPRVEVRTAGEAVSELGRRLARLVLTPSQLDLVTRAPARVCVTGPPGTGKTVVLILTGLRWMLGGEDVQVVSTRPASLASCQVMYYQLKMTFQSYSESRAPEVDGEDAKPMPTVRLHKFDFYKEDEVDRAIDDLSAAAVSRQGRLHILLEEAVFKDSKKVLGPRYHRLINTLLDRFPSLCLWIARVRHDNIPESLDKEILTQPLRSAPVVLREIQPGVDMHNVHNYDDTAGMAAPADGPKVLTLRHEGNGHSGQWPHQCRLCGVHVADVLMGQLAVGSKERATPKSPHPLRFSDVFVMTRDTSLTDDVTDDATGRVTSRASGVVLGLREKGVPVRVLEVGPAGRLDPQGRGDDEGSVAAAVASWERDVADTAEAASDRVTVAHWRPVLGLERKVVVWLKGWAQGEDEARSRREVDAWDRVWLVSRCTTQLVVVDCLISPPPPTLSVIPPNVCDSAH